MVDAKSSSEKALCDNPSSPQGPAERTGRIGEWVWCVLTIAACTGAAALMFPYFELVDVAMIYLLGVVITASWTSKWPALFAAFLSVAAFDFFFVPPRFTFAVSNTRYFVTFFVMFFVAFMTSRLTLRARQQAADSRLKEQKTAALYDLSRNLASERDQERLKAIAAQHIGSVFGSQVTVLLPDSQGRIEFPPAGAGDFRRDDREREAAQWALDQHLPSGANIPTGPDADASYFPLAASRGTVGVVGIRPQSVKGWFDPVQIRYLEAFTNQTAIAIERALLVEEAHHASMQAETERLRNTLLSSISHDLKTPLTAITGAVSTLLQNDLAIDQQNRLELLQTIQEEADRLNRIIKNILDMTRLESGAIKVNKEWQSLEEIVGVALNRLGDRLNDHPLLLKLPGNLPLIPFDGLLLEQVFINLFENAMKYTPTGSPLELTASEDLYTVTVELADRGPGIPAGEEERIFEKFVRGRAAGAGVGLGLAICRAVITAHGGAMWAENRPGGGAVFKFTLSAAGIPPLTKGEEETEVGA
jgi:two-component system sensor histidine kinase KdpD